MWFPSPSPWGCTGSPGLHPPSPILGTAGPTARGCRAEEGMCSVPGRGMQSQQGAPRPALTSEEFGLLQKLLLRLPQALQVPGFHLAALLVLGIQWIRAGEIHHIEHFPGMQGWIRGSGLGDAPGEPGRIAPGMLQVIQRMLCSTRGGAWDAWGYSNGAWDALEDA